MKYKEKLIELVFDKTPNAFENWLKTQPLLEQVVILKELKQMSLQNMFKSQDFSIAKTLKTFASKIDAYEKAVLAGLEAEAAYNKALEEQKKQMKKIEETTLGVKEYVINCVVNKESNAKEMLELARKIIALEKETGFYDENLWQPILKLL